MSAEAKDAAQVAAERLVPKKHVEKAAAIIHQAYASHAPAVRELAAQAARPILDTWLYDAGIKVTPYLYDSYLEKLVAHIARIFAPLEQQAELRAGVRELLDWQHPKSFARLRAALPTPWEATEPQTIQRLYDAWAKSERAHRHCGERERLLLDVLFCARHVPHRTRALTESIAAFDKATHPKECALSQGGYACTCKATGA